MSSVYDATNGQIVATVSPRGQPPWQSHDFDTTHKG
jgi:hypothetical protein